MKPVRLIAVAAIGLLTLVSCREQPEHGRRAVLHVAAAANLRPALDDAAAEFERRHPEIRIELSYSGSGTIFAQIGSAAPFDIFFSADSVYPAKLAAARLADGAPFVYAYGRLAVWTPRGFAVDLEHRGLAALDDSRVKRIAMANPRLAPYGEASVRAMKRAGVFEQLQSRIIYGENVMQAAQFAESGNADAAFVPASLLEGALATNGSGWMVPTALAPPVEQSGVVLERSHEQEAARLFRDFILGSEGRQILERYRYELPRR